MRLSTPRVFAHLRHLLLGCCLLTTFAWSSLAQASPPQSIKVQATLQDGLGNELDGVYTLVFRLYDQPSGGVPLASETRMVTVTNGLFDVSLDTLGNPDLYRSSGGGSEDWHYGVSVAGEAELLPRLRIGTVPFAHVSTSVNGDVETTPGTLLIRAESGSPDDEIESSVVPGTSSMAISVKGTGADKNRVISSVYADSTVESTTLSTAGGASSGIESKTKPKKATVLIHNMPSPGHTTLTRSSATEDTATIVVSTETNGDNDPEGEGSMVVTPGTCSVAIKTRGTGADKNRVISTTNQDSALHVLTADLDGDDDPEGDYSAVVMPGTCSVAIKTKGTGADKNRISSTVYADSTVEVTTLSSAGGASSGIESKTKPKKVTVTNFGMPSPGHTTLTRSSVSGDTAAFVASVDTTGDDDPEGDYSAIVMPGTCSVAIKTRGTGADKNRVISTTTEDSATFEVSVDTTGDDSPEGSVYASATPRSGTLVVAVAGASHGTFMTTTPDSTKVQVSSDDESSISMSTKPTGVGTPGSSSLSLHHTSGGVTGTIQLSTDDFASAINLIDDGLTTYRVGSNDGMQMMDNSGIAVTVIDRLGNAAFSSSVGVGVSSTTHPIEHSSGAHLTVGGTWTNASDVNLKENFEDVDGAELLDQLSRLPISKWNYKNEGTSAAHIGPTAQDFQKTFGVGSDGKSISTIDPSGIALAALKELEGRNRELSQQNDLLQEKLEALLHRVEQLERSDRAK